MNTLNLIFTILMIVGFIMIIYSIVMINKNNNTTPISDIDNSIKKIQDAMDKADLAIDDLNLLSEKIFKNFDEKQKQLLFLYDAIEKKKAISNNNSRVDIKLDEKVLMPKKQDNKKIINSHPMAKKINEMALRGMSVPDIAKTLNMGQGAVELIINLGKEN